MAFVIVRQRTANTKWLVAPVPPRWGERNRAMRFDTRGDARRVAVALKLSGDRAIDMAPPPQISAVP
jgi:hypothetical protein